MPELVRLKTPLELFKEFNVKLDETLMSLDELGEIYPNLVFTEEDVKKLTLAEKKNFQEELIQHAQMVYAFLNHPAGVILQQTADKNELSSFDELEVPLDTYWQHYKGKVYKVVKVIKSTDFHCEALLYHSVDNPSEEYCISKLAFFSKRRTETGELIPRFTQIDK